MKIGVGSTNPAKITASREAFHLVRENKDLTLFSVNVNSGVSSQPVTDEEAIRGAKNRALSVMEHRTCAFAVGLEGSVSKSNHGTFLTGWAYLIDDKGEHYIGGGGRLKLPSSLAERIMEGEKLGDIMDELTGRDDIGEGPGAIGVFTTGVITRKDAYRNAIVFALAKMLRPQFYGCID